MNCRIDLLPGVLEDGLQKSLLICEVLDDLRLACTCEPTDCSCSSGLVALLGEQRSSCFADALAARGQDRQFLRPDNPPHRSPLSPATTRKPSRDTKLARCRSARWPVQRC